MTAFRGDVRSGNSGGPVVNGAGEVETTVFAASTGQGPQSGLGSPQPDRGARPRQGGRRGRDRPLRRLGV